MNETKTPANYAVGSAKSIRLPGDTFNNDPTDISVTYRFQNRTDRPITVTRRDGVRFSVRPTSRFNTIDEFRIYVQYSASRDVIKNIAEVLNESSNTGIEHDKILRSMRKAYNKGNSNPITATVEYIVVEDQLRNAGGRVYLADLDIVVEMGGLKPMTHPFSNAGIERHKLNSIMPSCTDNTLAFMFKAVDNSEYKLFTDRFINIGGLVFRIPVERDDAFGTGVHVISRSPIDVKVQAGDDVDELTSTFYTFEEADKRFGLYLTAEEAKVAGPLVESKKEQANLFIAEAKLESIKDERGLQILRNQQQQQKLELDMQLNGGKSFLEYAKVGTAILTAVVTVLTIWQKLAVSK